MRAALWPGELLERREKTKVVTFELLDAVERPFTTIFFFPIEEL